MRRRPAEPKPPTKKERRPEDPGRDAVRRAQDVLFDRLAKGDRLDAALVATARRLISAGAGDRARSLLDAMRDDAAGPSAADVAAGVVALADEKPWLGWQLLTRADRARALALAPAEYVRAGFLHDPETTALALSDALRDETISAGAAEWFDIAGTSFAAGREADSRTALGHARAAAESADDDVLLSRIAWLESWYGRRERARGQTAVPTGTVSFAVLDYKQPDEAYASKNLGDHVQTIAALGHLARRSGFTFTGDPEAVGVLESLQRRVRPDRVVGGDDATIDLHVVQRDATHLDLVPDGTWVLAFGWYMHPQFGVSFDMPFNERLRPIFVSFHVNTPSFLTRDVVEYLARHAPVGCRDWNTVHLLLAAGVPAFFSGCVTTTIDTVFPAGDQVRDGETLYVDTEATGPGVTWTQTDPAVRRRSFADNVDDALEVLHGYRTRWSKVVTSRLHCYLPARSLGADVEFRARNLADVRFGGLVGIDDEAYDRIRHGMLDLLEPIIGAIGAGRSEDEVYALWREVTAPAVAEAETLRRGAPPLELRLDLDAARAAVLDRVSTRPGAQGAGESIPMAAVVRPGSIDRFAELVGRVASGSSRPLHVHALTSTVDPAVLDRIADRFPAVTFTWLPTDDVDHGGVTDAARKAIDVLLLPRLMHDHARVVLVDSATRFSGDLAALVDLDLGGHPLAARSMPPSKLSSGLGTAIVASRRLGDDALARDLILRTHTRNGFDFVALHAGVVVLDLDRLRADDVAREFVPWVERFGLGLRDVLNVYVGPDRAELDPRWNPLPHLEVIDSLPG